MLTNHSIFATVQTDVRCFLTGLFVQEDQPSEQLLPIKIRRSILFLCIQADIGIPISKAAILQGLVLCQHKIGKSKHGGHILFIAVIMPRYAKQISGLTLGII